MHVARLAGLPKKVLDRAEELLTEYDSDNGQVQAAASCDNVQSEMMGSLFTSNIAQEILNIDVMSMTPIEAMNTLYKLQDEARKELGK